MVGCNDWLCPPAARALDFVVDQAHCKPNERPENAAQYEGTMNIIEVAKGVSGVREKRSREYSNDDICWQIDQRNPIDECPARRIPSFVADSGFNANSVRTNQQRAADQRGHDKQEHGAPEWKPPKIRGGITARRRFAEPGRRGIGVRIQGHNKYSFAQAISVNIAPCKNYLRRQRVAETGVMSSAETGCVGFPIANVRCSCRSLSREATIAPHAMSERGLIG